MQREQHLTTALLALSLVATIHAKELSSVAEKIRSMEGEWIIISEAGTTVPKTNMTWIVQNDVCGGITVSCAHPIERTNFSGPYSIRTIIFPTEQTETAWMYSADKTDNSYSHLIGKYNSTNNCLTWFKNSGLRDCLRWRFSPDNLHFSEEIWDNSTEEWTPSGRGSVYSRKSALPGAMIATSNLITNGHRDAYGNLVSEYNYRQKGELDGRSKILHVPDAVFSDDDCFHLMATVKCDSVVTQVIADIHLNAWVVSPDRHSMTRVTDCTFSASIPTKQFDSYSICAYCTDGSTWRSAWIRPFRYPAVYNRRDFKKTTRSLPNPTSEGIRQSADGLSKPSM